MRTRSPADRGANARRRRREGEGGRVVLSARVVEGFGEGQRSERELWSEEEEEEEESVWREVRGRCSRW